MLVKLGLVFNHTITVYRSTLMFWFNLFLYFYTTFIVTEDCYNTSIVVLYYNVILIAYVWGKIVNFNEFHDGNERKEQLRLLVLGKRIIFNINF